SGAAPPSSSSFRPAIPPNTPMTDRLYYTDPYLREFDGSIVRVEERDGRAHVVLDRTAFYPTSGGQPFDTGTLGGFPIVDVFDDDDGILTHVLETASLQIGQTITAPIN